MKPLEELVRPNIRALKPYSTARDEFSGGEITTWLDANHERETPNNKNNPIFFMHILF